MNGMFLSGTLSEHPVSKAKLDGGSGTYVPFICFELMVEFDLGLGQTKTDAVKCLLLGETQVQWWEAQQPNPGDTVRLMYCLAYVNKGSLCCRITDVNQIEIVKNNLNQFITADDYFSALLAHKKLKGD